MLDKLAPSEVLAWRRQSLSRRFSFVCALAYLFADFTSFDICAASQSELCLNQRLICRSSNCINHGPKVFQRGVQLHIVCWPNNQATSFSHRRKPCTYFGFNLCGGTEWQSMLLIYGSPKAKIFAVLLF